MHRRAGRTVVDARALDKHVVLRVLAIEREIARGLINYSSSESRRIAHELADLAHCITVPCVTHRKAHSTRKAAADALAAPLRKVLYSLDDMAANQTLVARQAQQADLLALIDAAHAMYIKLNG